MSLVVQAWMHAYRAIHLVYRVYSGYTCSGHFYSGHLDIVVTFPGTKYIYSIIFKSDMVASRI